MRLIDADVMKESMDNQAGSEIGDIIIAWINRQPTVDAEPVRHGRWLKKSYWQPISSTATRDFPFYECTQCGWSRRFAIDYSYCPNCGAKMDLDQ